MFSGIVQELGRVEQVTVSEDRAVIKIHGGVFSRPERKIGDSVCISGVCLTIVELDHNTGTGRFDLASETRRCTTLGALAAGDLVNLEPSLKVGDEIHGHFVQGHVDAVASLISRTTEGNTIRLAFSKPRTIADLISAKGSITLDGVSLTVGEVEADSFSVYIIPHTADVTTLGALQSGGKVNVEADCLARYVKTILQHQES